MSGTENVVVINFPCLFIFYLLQHFCLTGEVVSAGVWLGRVAGGGLRRCVTQPRPELKHLH